MNREETWARAERAREALGGHLDEMETRFRPGYIARIAGFALRRSLNRHPMRWRIAGVSLGALLLGLLAWAVLSDDE